MKSIGAGNEIRTRDPDLGKVVLYQLSYSRFFSMACILTCVEFMSMVFFRILNLYAADIFDYCTLIDKAHFQIGFNGIGIGIGIVFIDGQGY